MRHFAGHLAAAALTVAAVDVRAAPIVYNDFYEDYSQKSCAGDFSCRVDFSQTPAGKYLTVKRLACYLESDQPLRTIAFGRTRTPGGLSPSSIPVPFIANTTGNGKLYYMVNQEIEFKMPGQYYMWVTVETSAGAAKYVSCTITGVLTSK